MTDLFTLSVSVGKASTSAEPTVITLHIVPGMRYPSTEPIQPTAEVRAFFDLHQEGGIDNIRIIEAGNGWTKSGAAQLVSQIAALWPDPTPTGIERGAHWGNKFDSVRRDTRVVDIGQTGLVHLRSTLLVGPRDLHSHGFVQVHESWFDPHVAAPASAIEWTMWTAGSPTKSDREMTLRCSEAQPPESSSDSSL